MVDITIKNVPEDCVEDVKEMALVAVKRYLKKKELQIDEEKVTSYNTKVEEFMTSNSLNKSI
jgi:hypothetical protein